MPMQMTSSFIQFDEHAIMHDAKTISAQVTVTDHVWSSSTGAAAISRWTQAIKIQAKRITIEGIIALQ